VSAEKVEEFAVFLDTARKNFTHRTAAAAPLSRKPVCQGRISRDQIVTRCYNLAPRARAHLRSTGLKCHRLWDNQKPDATFAASGFLKRMYGSF